MKTLQRLMLALWILLIPFQNSALQGTPLGYLAASPAFIPLMGLVYVSALLWCAKRDRAKINLSMLLVVLYAVIVNVAYLLLAKSESHGTGLVAKTVNLSILTFLMLYPVFFIDYRPPSVGWCVHIAFAVTVAGVILGDLMGLDTLLNKTGLSYHPNANMRPRGFTLESSWLSALVITLGLLSAHYSKGRWARLGVLVIAGGVLMYSGSKGGILCLSIALLIAIARQLRTRPALAVYSIPVAGLMAYTVYGMLSLQFTRDIAEFTSLATRLGLVVTSVLTVISNPLGVGFSGFLPAVDKYTPLAAAILERTANVKLHLAELLSYVGSASDFAIGTKTLLFDFLMYYGWPFLLGFIVFHYRLLRKLADAENVFVWLAVVYSVIAVCTYVNPIGLYNFSLVYGVALYEIRRKKHAARVA